MSYYDNIQRVEDLTLSVNLRGYFCSVGFSDKSRLEHINKPASETKPLKNKVAISAISVRSLMKLMTAYGEILTKFTALLTLTIAHLERDGELFKNQLTLMFKYLERKYPGIVIFWWVEFQERGSPHVHLMLSEYVNPQEISDKWANLWLPRLVDCFGARLGLHARDKMRSAAVNVKGITSSEDLTKYASKLVRYAAKSKQKTVPLAYLHVGRSWGVRGKPKLMAAATIKKRLSGYYVDNLDEFKQSMFIFMSKLCLSYDVLAYDWKFGYGFMLVYKGVDSKAWLECQRVIKDHLIEYYGVEENDIKRKLPSVTTEKEEETYLYLDRFRKDSKK